MKLHNRQITIIGASDDTVNRDAAYSIGREIARRNYILVTGGRGGVMEWASKGAREAGGIVTGILPGNDFSEANDYCTVIIPTGMGHGRNCINILSAEAVIAIGGKGGTLNEITFAWMYGKPVIACAFADGWSSRIFNIKIDDRRGAQLIKADSIEDVFLELDRLFNLA